MHVEQKRDINRSQTYGPEQYGFRPTASARGDHLFQYSMELSYLWRPLGLANGQSPSHGCLSHDGSYVTLLTFYIRQIPIRMR